MTPREWHYLATAMDEEGLDWEWTRNGSAIAVRGERTWVTVYAHQGGWLIECEELLPSGGYYDPPEYRHSHDEQCTDIEDVVAIANQLTKENTYV